MRSSAAAAVVLIGCGAGSQSVIEIDEMPAGACARQKLAPGERCTKSARDYSVGATVGAPHGHASELAGTAWFRWPLFDVSLDERTMRRGTLEDHSLAGGVGTHLRPLILWPAVNRYVDYLVDLGFELGGLKKDTHVEGRGDAYVATALDFYAPDFGPFRYLDTGIPGIRVGLRYTAYVQGWDHDLALEVGLIWRWGVAIDLYHHWTTQRTGD
jgi:hypothetical protein